MLPHLFIPVLRAVNKKQELDDRESRRKVDKNSSQSKKG
jgi:hypothetical protein